MSRSSMNPWIVSMTGLVGLLGIGRLCDALLQFLENVNMRTFSLSYALLWVYALVSLLLAAGWLLAAWVVLFQGRSSTGSSLVYLLVGLFILAYPALYMTPALCCRMPDIRIIQLGPTMYLYSTGGWVAVLGAAGLIWRGRRKAARE
ncbi:MAG TPA: hypothetical protein VMT91_03655 [Anaerolineales bacterium]|nr:hypothetical protein [Anaerolineales bacterium]